MSTEESMPAQRGQDLSRQGGVVAGMTLVSRITGLLRDVILSYLFGASAVADMFFVALRIPNFFRRLFAEGAFNQAFVPVLTRYANEGRASLLAFIAPLSGLFALTLSLVVLLGVLMAPQITALFAPGFVADEAKLEATAALVRITFPYLGFIALTAYAGSLLNVHGRFALPAFTPVLLNLSLIAAALTALAGVTHWPAASVLAWGVLLAGLMQLLVQLPVLVRLGLLPRPNLEHRQSGVRQVGKLLVPAVLAASVGQINALVNTALASTLMTGSIAWLYYADRLLELPIGLVAVALGTVMLPHLSRQVAQDDRQQFRRTLDWGLNLGLMLAMPAAVALFVLAEGLLASLYMSFATGAMTALDVRMAALALQMFAVALPGFVLVKILAPAFFANEDTRTPLRYAAGAVAANLMVSLASFRWFGHVGLAWATAISAWTHALLLYAGLRRQELYTLTGQVWPLLWRTLLSSTVLGGVLVVVAPADMWLEVDPWARLGWILGISLAGMLLYVGLMALLGVRLAHIRHISGTDPGL